VRNFACLAVFTFGSLVSAQQPAQPSPAQANPSQVSPVQPPATPAPVTANVVVDLSKPATPQTPQQKQLADDTAKLLTLASELKAALDKSNQDTLSISVIRKAEQVEKLAHKVRDEMKASLPN
jgi:hypothetical protein